MPKGIYIRKPKGFVDAKLTEKQKLEIIEGLKKGEKQHYLAMKYGVKQSNIGFYNRKYVKAA